MSMDTYQYIRTVTLNDRRSLMKDLKHGRPNVKIWWTRLLWRADGSVFTSERRDRLKGK